MSEIKYERYIGWRINEYIPDVFNFLNDGYIEKLVFKDKVAAIDKINPILTREFPIKMFQLFEMAIFSSENEISSGYVNEKLTIINENNDLSVSFDFPRITASTRITIVCRKYKNSDILDKSKNIR